MQLALILPIYIILFRKNAWAGHLWAWLSFIGCTFGICYVSWKYELKAGPLAENNWYLFSYLFQKPWFKINTQVLGVLTAYFYMQVLSYRKISDSVRRETEHPFWDFMHKNKITQVSMFLIGIGCVLFGLFSGHDAIENAMNWSTALNVAYYGGVRPVYVLGLVLIFFTFIVDGFSYGKTFLSRPLFIVLGHLSFETALISPIMIQLIYATMPRGLFISFNKVLELGVGNTLAAMAAAFALFICVEFPMTRLSQIFVVPKLSHD